MSVKKVLISFCLLLAYSLGFAHDVIPHCHHSHEHHPPVDVPSSDFHVDQAEDHECDGFICFLHHILSSIDHPHSDDTHALCDLAQVPHLGKNWLVKVDFQAMLVKELRRAFVPQSNVYYSFPRVDYLSPIISVKHTRGPPTTV